MFGDVLNQLRQEAGLTQQELADRAEVHRTYISLLERGKKSPTLEVIFRLARSLERRPSELLARLEDEMSEHERWW